MILTGKALEDFGKYLHNKYGVLFNYEDYNKTMLYAEILEWFDSVSIFIDSIHSLSFDYTLEFCATVNRAYVSHGIKDKPINRFDTRQQAIKQAIIKANEIYNDNNK